MKKVIISTIVVALCILMYMAVFKHPEVGIEQNDNSKIASEDIAREIVKNVNQRGISFYINNQEVIDNEYQPYMSNSLRLMVPSTVFTDMLDCSVNIYSNGTISLEKSDSIVKIYCDSYTQNINGNVVQSKDKPVEKNGIIYVPANDICEALNYAYAFDFENNVAKLDRITAEEKLPSSYDMREYNRVSPVRDQGIYGTCWAFASLAALETTVMPEENLVFSVDHMTLSNSFNVSPNDGGQYNMSIAYLAAWQGPVLEKDDPYGDHKTKPSLSAVKHLQEAIIIKDKDYNAVKSSVYKYGGVETVIYCDLQNATSSSYYYNKNRASYYYDGENAPNHDVVIVGWNDDFPKEYFNIEPEGDGAFICKNSWGKDFGEDGYFYISYYDTNICSNSVVYTKLGDADNYDNIYQSDLMGQVGTMGFDDKTEAYFANAYTTKTDEILKAVGFYATGPKTTYEVYVVETFEDMEDLKKRRLVAKGEMEYEGYYTINLNDATYLPAGRKFAVVVHVNTQSTVMPVAIEYKNDERTANFDIIDGEGYISLYGSKWYSAEKDNNCNVCLKAFTDTVNMDETSIPVIDE